MNNKEIQNTLKAEWLWKYQSKNKSVFAYDSSGQVKGRAKNGWASYFWAGYDQMKSGVRVPCKTELAYGIYLAGKAARGLN